MRVKGSDNIQGRPWFHAIFCRNLGWKGGGIGLEEMAEKKEEIEKVLQGELSTF